MNDKFPVYNLKKPFVGNVCSINILDSERNDKSIGFTMMGVFFCQSSIFGVIKMFRFTTRLKHLF